MHGIGDVHFTVLAPTQTNFDPILLDIGDPPTSWVKKQGHPC